MVTSLSAKRIPMLFVLLYTNTRSGRKRIHIGTESFTLCGLIRPTYPYHHYGDSYMPSLCSDCMTKAMFMQIGSDGDD